MAYEHFMSPCHERFRIKITEIMAIVRWVVCNVFKIVKRFNFSLPVRSINSKRIRINLTWLIAIKKSTIS